MRNAHPLALAFLLLALPAAPARAGDLADWPFEDLGDIKPDYREATLAEILEHPAPFRNMHVRFLCRFDRPAEASLAFYTRFRDNE